MYNLSAVNIKKWRVSGTTLLFLFVSYLSLGQSPYYFQRASHFESLPKQKKEIVFIGNSITDGAEWSELFQDLQIKNRGISGDVTSGILARVAEVYNRKPAKIFLMIGINDLRNGLSPDSILNNILSITHQISENSPATQIYVQSILPVNPRFTQFSGHTAKASLIPVLNKLLKENARHYQYIDLNTHFSDKNGNLKDAYTNDGLHLLGQGYRLWKRLILPYVYDLNQKPSLIPLPQDVEWTNQYFDLSGGVEVKYSDKRLASLAKTATALFAPYKTLSSKTSKPLYITVEDSAINNDEAYELRIDSTAIWLTARKPHGIFNGLQTLRQLLRDGVFLPGCTIRDLPAFAWRGLMHDVGRNYQPISLLKEQIELMSYYKMNIFHFHLTEDVAWRLESKKYPQLTSPEFMTRNAGEYYSQNELRDLIKFCKERYITLIPEIDMPGHSEAFKKAMGVDMQSTEGVKIVKELLTEFCDTFDVPIIHIGGDEVKITNPHFLPEMISLLESKGKKVMGWLPGGNLSPSVIHQLWQGNVGPPTGIPSVDSRFIYINHHDPLESVITLFQSKFLDVNQGDNTHLGGIICVWPDRRVSTPQEVYKQNPVYPALLAGAERLWRGGGHQLGTTLIYDLPEFTAFENRLLDHKKLYFKHLPFPYTKQSDIVWQISEPFNNNGDLTKIFSPEKQGNLDGFHSTTAHGGTVYLRHWWFPMAESYLKTPKENSTIYASTKVWSAVDRQAAMWIGFNHISTSMQSDSPPIGQWDNRHSKVWINGSEIPSFPFARAGKKGNLEVPLIDESYEYRPTTLVNLKKGWNTILVKAPVGSFKSTWENPVKWMFTAVLVEED